MQSPTVIYSSNTNENVEFREYIYFELMKASEQEYNIFIDNTQDNEINDWDNINIFDNISNLIKKKSRGKKKHEDYNEATDEDEYQKVGTSSDISEHEMSVEGKNINWKKK